MDGSALEHSDSDSGESWTLLENTPSYEDEAPEFAENSPKQCDVIENVEKDEDTDGISIISDSDPESGTPCDLSYDKCILEDGPPAEQPIPKYVSANPLPYNSHDNDHESMRADDFLGDSKCKLKTYVHRRNKRLSTVLNIIVLGSVITAAGVAIGHMWGARHDCAGHSAPSVNKILSNLYKLQEENAYLRNKLKELTLMTTYQMHQRKMEIEKGPLKQHRCRKVFEEPLNNKNSDTFIKCVDGENLNKNLENHLVGPEYEKDFLNDIDKLKHVYQQNKSWLDLEIAKRMKHENESIKKFKTNLKSPKSIKINEERKFPKKESLVQPAEVTSEPAPATETVINVTELVQPVYASLDEVEDKENVPEKKVSYADSLKSESKTKKNELNEQIEPGNKINFEPSRKKRHLKEYDTISENSVSEEEVKKDDRYNSHKYKPDRKKNDRQKIHKKQKRKNKYEQWEMKGGYMKDYDDFSVSSSQENEYILKNPDRNFLSRDFERNNYINLYSDTEDGRAETPEVARSKNKSENCGKREKRGRNADRDVEWYERRAALRSQARRRLERELFGGAAPGAAWYWSRARRRRAARAAPDLARPLSKRTMNFKTKH